ncbi:MULTISPECIES: NADH-quinone oxidoreductase subunit H [Pseudobutyrivibrio]|uniref:Ech hydrogenase subunit B n=2 Tax=Pseudobutyrivibrio ruminis TaxID=46206 RepID=A0A1H7F0Q2_9FIRM|nr:MULTISPECIES: NADH-quinone oxidoreductase subunit H [Pseudobutyrivibrio]SEK17570.1 ech hydrogenase subunit B [Pseudobutyrivibrio ruminis]SES86733.1 ech hydrogenase subunit B [Pseudobutyrivibrio sp. C4]SFO07652.1 ech hydrogenase subunit B [Pseudobutyrivibrio sp. JW11]SOC01930.1 ech hydrogenase subunit B [Pseudobutyrivibrio ruminis DSM 9787]
MTTTRIIIAVLYVLLAPFVIGLLDGFDRKISARMQGRRGPSVLQPFFDIKKLFEKEFLTANKQQLFMIYSYVFFIVLSGVIFFAGFDLLLVVFSLSTAAMFLILASTSTHSPFSSQGTHRELVQIMSCEPMELLVAVGFYLATKTFNVNEIVMNSTYSNIIYLPGFFVGFVFILTIKFRKSPFDISTSHHAHQEVIKGVTSEMVGKEYGMVTLAEWYENAILLGIVGLFFLNSNPLSVIGAIVAILVVWFLEILIDNTSARVKWQLMLKLAWGVTIVAAGMNLFLLEIIMG